MDRRTHSSAPDLARRFRALGDPTRLAILAMLRDCCGSLCACDIEGRFELSQPTISHHLRQLKAAGLVEVERRGTWMHFRIAPDGLETLSNFLRELEPLEER